VYISERKYSSSMRKEIKCLLQTSDSCLPFRMMHAFQNRKWTTAIQAAISDNMLKVFTQVQKPGGNKLTWMLLDYIS
jgi:hypothetical protein